MYIHIGGERVIRSADLIVIFDISIEQDSNISKQFLENANDQKRVEVIGSEASKSLVVTASKIYYSPISPSTLKKRTHSMNKL